MRHAPAIVVCLCLVATLRGPVREARAVGVYEDAAGYAGFLVAPHRTSAVARFIGTDTEDTRASMVHFAGRFAPRPGLLVDLELPFITTAVPGRDIQSGFGDLRVRLRQDLWRGRHARLALAADLGTGTGTGRVFPYASESLEFGLALAYVDTLDILHWWASAGGAIVGRQSDEAAALGLVDDYGRVGAGLMVPLGGRTGVRLGLSVLLFESGITRDVYFARVHWDYSKALRLVAGAQIEAAPGEDRATDTAGEAGIVVYFP
ncbi:MAG: hypothetical protein OEO21_00655 [Candidatus Krumholzibacteria bacterium]|nr:hypothetical protein [Candidatus Krumholzibacteria bacterium]